MEAPLLQSRGTNHGRKEGNDDDNKEFDSSVLGDFGNESRTLWKIAGPAIFTSISQYSLGALTQTFTGFVGELELAAVSVENSVVAGLAFGVMLGMGSALETLCGQAYGAGQIRMLGIYMQRSWVILLTTACLLVPVYIWSPPILTFFGETSEISNAAGEFAIWMLPQLFAYALNFPIQKFLQAQSKVMVMAWISAVVLVLHTFFSWLLILKLGWGLVGAALVLNASWCIIVVAQLGYIFITGSDGAWNGFSWLAFSDLWGFVKLSLASAVMLCLEFWYLMVLVVITGRLPNPLIPVDAISICISYVGRDRGGMYDRGIRDERFVPRAVHQQRSGCSGDEEACWVAGVHCAAQQPSACFIWCRYWSWMAISGGLHQYWMLLHSWVACWDSSGFHVWFWS
ncbi:unnamed protein product [Linum tenue]|uniref:Multidrug and toxic compound extrusion protein n=1 Tax=Linum tenue TaxID=586396 RepID=A0AAV0KUY2_9ROSI|nr:unnamed protein product [Linum tenue]